MTWRDKPMAGFDTETTGVDVETARIVTACVGIAGQGGWAPRGWLLRQSQPIPEGATAIHGITTEHANEHGVEPAEALPRIVDALYGAWGSGFPVVAYNAVFDLTVLDRELRRHGLGELEVAGPVIDPLVIDKALDPYRRGSRKLIDTARNYGITLSEHDAHGAEADALTACRLAWKLSRRASSGDPSVIDELGWLHAWQQEKYQQQRELFFAYKAKRGEACDDLSTEWPLRTYVAEGVRAA